MTIERRFNDLASELLAGDATVERGKMLHAPGLRTGGKFFAFMSANDIVVKLPAARVQELIASGAGRPCVIRKGWPMREWVRLSSAAGTDLTALVTEARDFVAGLERRRD